MLADILVPQRPPVAAILKPGAAYHEAASGGKRAGTLRVYTDKPDAMVERGIATLRKRIAEHQDKIARPDIYLPPDIDPRFRADLIARKWPKEIAGFQAEVEVLEGLLIERRNNER